MSSPSPSLRALVAGLVDYAGLFPPAALAMSDAVARYAEYLDSPDAWMLGRLVVPVARLDELSTESARYTGSRRAPWRLSALAGDDVQADAAAISDFNARHVGRLAIDVAEAKAATVERIAQVASALGTGLALFVEVPHDADPRDLLAAVKHHGARAKIRTGGVTADAIPTAAQIARFIARCAELHLPFKATAGLHHPLRAEHHLTYRPDSPSATMFGFLNVFVAAVLAAEGARRDELEQVLEERAASAFTFAANGLRWRDHHVALDQVARARETFAVAFGSCSFREPVDDLQELALL